jgi:hypothetical protein
VYVAGDEGTPAKYWKNGTAVSLTNVMASCFIARLSLLPIQKFMAKVIGYKGYISATLNNPNNQNQLKVNYDNFFIDNLKSIFVPDTCTHWTLRRYAFQS